MRKLLLVTIAILLLAGISAYEYRLSPEFKTQLKLLNASFDEQQKEQKQQMDLMSLRHRLENDRLEENNAQLEIQIAQLEGKAVPLEKLRRAKQLEQADELAIQLGENAQQMRAALGAKFPSPDSILASLPSHASTLRDYLVIRHMKEAQRLNTEAELCYQRQTSEALQKGDIPECSSLVAQSRKQANYIEAAMK